MQNVIRFSLFGNYERFSTNNLDNYMRLIDFFGKRGYKPATTNEMQLQQNGQAHVLVMPVFVSETGAVIEITSKRINFHKDISDVVGVEEMGKEFVNDFFDLLDVFVTDLSIESNRVALNCYIFMEKISLDMPTQSTYFDHADQTEMTVRNVTQKEVEKEASNIIVEKYVNIQGGFTRYSYDINTIGENQTTRFNKTNIKKLYEAYIRIAMEIEKGLK